MKLTGAAILVLRGMKVLQAAPAAYPFRSATEGRMSWFQDLDTHTMVASGNHVRAIGWLASDQPFPQGEVSPGFLARLEAHVRLAGRSAEALSFPAFGGFHECELCDRPGDPGSFGPCGTGNLGVPDGSMLYVAPELVAHYVRVHRYQPPAEFVAALMAAPLPDTPEYGALAEPFARLHRAEWERAFQRRIEHAGRRAQERGGTDEAVWEAVQSFCPWTAEMFERVRTAMQEAEQNAADRPRPM
jgi:hypothetical protein